jgi:hypothetical protein
MPSSLRRFPELGENFVPPFSLRIGRILDLQSALISPVHAVFGFRHDAFKIALADFLEERFSASLKKSGANDGGYVALEDQLSQAILSLQKWQQVFAVEPDKIESIETRLPGPTE